MQLITVETARGSTLTRSVESHGDAVAVLPYDPVRKCAVLVRQLRVPMLVAGVEPHTLEVPAGMLDEADPQACARREAMEEAGVELHGLDHIGTMVAMPGISTERIHLYLAAYSAEDRIGEGGGLAEEVEEIEVVELPLATLAASIDAGEMMDMKTVVLVEALRRRRPALF